MDLVSMKLSDDERREAVEVSEDMPDYPWGLGIWMDADQIEKLKAGDLKAGDTVMLHARAVVRERSEREDERGSDKSLRLQMTDMALAPEAEKPSAASILYGDD